MNQQTVKPAARICAANQGAERVNKIIHHQEHRRKCGIDQAEQIKGGTQPGEGTCQEDYKEKIRLSG